MCQAVRVKPCIFVVDDEFGIRNENSFFTFRQLMVQGKLTEEVDPKKANGTTSCAVTLLTMLTG